MDKKYLKQIGLYLLTSLLSVALMLYIGYHMFYGLTQRVETAPALPATVETVVEAEVFLFRDELLLFSGQEGGSVVPTVPNGTKVGIHTAVAGRYDGSSPDTVSAIAEADEQIAVLTAMLNNTLSVRDAASIDRTVYSIMQRIASAAARGDAAAALSYRSELRAALSRRNIVTGATADVAGEIEEIRRQKEALTQKLGNLRETVLSTVSGYYYADADGYEELFTGETARTMTLSDFSALTAQPPAEIPENNAGKLVTDYRWYAACLLSRKAAENLTEGERYPVAFPHNGEITLSMTLTRAVPEGDRVLLVFETDKMPADFTYNRVQPAVITDKAYEGLRIPSSALRVVDGVTGVYVREGSVVHYRAVRLLVEGEDWCLVENQPEGEPPAGLTFLTQNEIVITKGRGLTEGRVLS